MALSEQYRSQVQLLMRLIPHVGKEGCFALKGGTAINLFFRDLPRLSVDIDLTYLPVQDRSTSLDEIDQALHRIEQSALKVIPDLQTNLSVDPKTGKTHKAVIRQRQTQVKIEVTPVLRGCVYKPELRPVTERVQTDFGFAEIQTVSFADLYAGKLMAALDRQHPRDLFDVRELLASEGITDDLREAFIVYLLGHGRGFHDVLAPNLKDLSHEYERGFVGMTTEPITLESLYKTRNDMIKSVVGSMPANHKELLFSVLNGDPNWSLLKVQEVEHLPAVKWRLQNLEAIDAKKRQSLIDALDAVFNN